MPQQFIIGVLYKRTTMPIMPVLASEALLHENKNIQWQNVTLQWVLNLGLSWTSDSKSNILLSLANWAFACKTETLGSLYSHAVLIPTKSSKS